MPTYSLLIKILKFFQLKGIKDYHDYYYLYIFKWFYTNNNNNDWIWFIYTLRRKEFYHLMNIRI